MPRFPTATKVAILADVLEHLDAPADLARMLAAQDERVARESLPTRKRAGGRLGALLGHERERVLKAVSEEPAHAGEGEDEGLDGEA